MAKVPLYTWDEIKKHTTEESSWIVIDGAVYDVTQFCRMHPGGAQLLVKRFGGDATSVFHNPKIHAHSQSAINLLNELRIGAVDDPSVDASKITLKRRDHGVDINKGMVWQMMQKGEKYEESLSKIGLVKQLEIKFFDYWWMEINTKSSWWLLPLFWIPSILYLYNMAITAGLPNPVVTIPISIVLGWFTWGLLEYAIHRWLFHGHFTSMIGICLHFMVHGQHHINPMNPMRLVFPPHIAALLAYILYYIFLKFTMPYNYGIALLAGTVLSYVIYDLSHYYMHHGVPIKFFKYLKRHHMIHHFKDPTNNFAISHAALTYDYLFGTWIEEHQVVAGKHKLF